MDECFRVRNHPHVVGVGDDSQFRVRVDTNTYSVPAEYARAALTLKLYPDHLCLYHQDKLIARHVRCYDRRRDFEDPDHPKALLAQRNRTDFYKLLKRHNIHPERFKEQTQDG